MDAAIRPLGILSMYVSVYACMDTHNNVKNNYNNYITWQCNVNSIECDLTVSKGRTIPHMHKNQYMVKYRKI